MVNGVSHVAFASEHFSEMQRLGLGRPFRFTDSSTSEHQRTEWQPVHWGAQPEQCQHIWCCRPVNTMSSVSCSFVKKLTDLVL